MSSSNNPTVRQRLLKISDALLRHLGLFDKQRFDLGQSFEMPQPGVGDPLGKEVQSSKLRQVFDAFQGSVGLHFGLDNVGSTSSPIQYRSHAGPGGDASGSGLPDWSISKSNLTPPPAAKIASTASLLPRRPLQLYWPPNLMAMPAEYDQHQQGYQAVSKPTAKSGDAGHAGSIVAGSGGFKQERVVASAGRWSWRWLRSGLAWCDKSLMESRQ